MPPAATAFALQEICGALKPAFGDAEAQFLALGNRLADAIGVFATLTATFESLSGELDNDALRAAGSALRDVAGHVSRLRDELAQEREALTQLIELSRRMRSHIGQLKGTVHTIAVLAINAQIVAAGIRAQEQDFLTFTAEITRLTEEVSSTIEAYSREYEVLASLFESAGATHARFERAHRQTLACVAEQLNASLEEVEARRLKAAGAAVEIGARSKDISREIAVIISATQIGDITRQRIEHVCEALDGAMSDGAALRAQEEEAVLSGVAALQARQLAQTAGQLEGEIHRLEGALGALAQDAANLPHLSRDMFADADGASFLEGLEGKLRATKGLIQEANSARGEVDQVIAGSMEALARLLQQVNSVKGIEVDMRLVGLNMGFKCARLGHEGQVLRVIEQELRAYARQILEDTTALVTAVNGLVAGAERLRAERMGADPMLRLERDMSDSLRAFEAGGARLSQALAALSTEGRRAEGILQGAADHLHAGKAAASLLIEMRERLAAIGERGGGLEHDALVKERIALLMKDKYTMASERDVHEAFGGTLAPARPDAPAATADDFLF